MSFIRNDGTILLQFRTSVLSGEPTLLHGSHCKGKSLRTGRSLKSVYCPHSWKTLLWKSLWSVQGSFRNGNLHNKGCCTLKQVRHTMFRYTNFSNVALQVGHGKIGIQHQLFEQCLTPQKRHFISVAVLDLQNRTVVLLIPQNVGPVYMTFICKRLDFPFAYYKELAF